MPCRKGLQDHQRDVPLAHNMLHAQTEDYSCVDDVLKHQETKTSATDARLIRSLMKQAKASQETHLLSATQAE